MEEELLFRLQKTQIEILDIIDRICKDCSIKYSLYAGTLLGAVRHQGFIPWDDDLDICMSRSEYNRFLEAWAKEKPEGYLLQNKENTPTFTQSFTKIRKEHTTFLQFEWERGQYHTGIFVDIFPIDRIPDTTLLKIQFWWNCLKYQLLTREYIPPKGNIIEKIIAKIILTCIPKKNRFPKRTKLLKRITKFKDPSLHPVSISTPASIQTPLPRDLLDSYVFLLFGKKEYMCFAGWDEYLSTVFGDYWQFPPESERKWKHHPIVLDFEHNLEELRECSKIVESDDVISL